MGYSSDYEIKSSNAIHRMATRVTPRAWVRSSPGTGCATGSHRRSRTLGKKMNTCIYTKAEFETSTGEHILQNFLGARWTDSTIVCNEVQKDFGDTIDSAFAESLNGFRTLLGTLGGRGGPPPSIKNVKDQQGNTYRLSSGGQPELARPVVDVRFREGGSADVRITLGNMSQMGWALHILKEQYPDLKFNPDAMAASAENTRDHLDSPLHLQFGIGGPEFFRGALKAVFNLLGATHREVAMSASFDDLRAFIVSGSGVSDSFVSWPTSHEPYAIPKLGAHDHFLAVWSRDGIVDGFIQLFGEIPFVLRLGSGASCDDFCASYLVNPHRDTKSAEVRSHDFDPTCLPAFDACPHLPGPDVWAAHEIRIRRFLAEYQRRAEDKVIHDIVHEVLGPKDGQIITKEDVDEIHQRMMKFVKFKLGIRDNKDSQQDAPSNGG